jgi:hypothetical protein
LLRPAASNAAITAAPVHRRSTQVLARRSGHSLTPRGITVTVPERVAGHDAVALVRCSGKTVTEVARQLQVRAEVDLLSPDGVAAGRNLPVRGC